MLLRVSVNAFGFDRELRNGSAIASRQTTTYSQDRSNTAVCWCQHACRHVHQEAWQHKQCVLVAPPIERTWRTHRGCKHRC